jgi:hypothetical protein
MTKLSKELEDLSKDSKLKDTEFARLYGYLAEITHKLEYIAQSNAAIIEHFKIKF